MIFTKCLTGDESVIDDQNGKYDNRALDKAVDKIRISTIPCRTICSKAKKRLTKIA